MGSHTCQDCGAQVVAAPGVWHDCPVRARRRVELAVAEARRVTARAAVFQSIDAERDRQEAIGIRKRGDGIDWRSCADPEMAGGDPMRCTVLGEEFGEVANAVLEAGYGTDGAGDEHLRDELVQVAAVGAAWVEAIDARRVPA